MRALSRDMVSAIEDNFEEEGRPKKWKKLKASTINQRKKQRTWPGRILQRSAGGLANSISGSHTKDTATAGTNKKYAAIHNYGGTIKHPGGTPYITTKKGAIFMKKDGKYPKGTKFTKAHDIKMPARPFMDFTQSDVKDFEDTITNYLTKGVN